MPLFDVKCGEGCNYERDDVYVAKAGELPKCPQCGAETVRVWKTFGPAIHGDDKFIGGKTFHNIAHEPITVHSRSELKRAMDKHGVRPFVRHQPSQGSDKSKHTSRWV